MATITLNIPDAELTRVMTALWAYAGITTPAQQTPATAKNAAALLVRNTVKAQEDLAAHQAIVPPTDPTVT